MLDLGESGPTPIHKGEGQLTPLIKSSSKGGNGDLDKDPSALGVKDIQEASWMKPYLA